MRHGLIWAVLDPTSAVPDVGAHLRGLDDDLALLGVGQHRFFRQNAVLRTANWKLIIDAFLEFITSNGCTPQRLGPYFADTKAVADHARAAPTLAGGTEELRRGAAAAAGAFGSQLHGTLVHFIFPNSLLVHHPDYHHMGIFPAGIDRSLFVHTVLTPEIPTDEQGGALGPLLRTHRR